MKNIKQYKLQQDDRPYSGKIKLFLTGFKKQNIISVDDIVNAVDRLPDSHLQGLHELIYDPLRSSLENVDYSQWVLLSKSKGSFCQQQRAVTIYDFDDKQMFHQVLYHEIGHYVFYLIIDSVMKKHWVTKLFPNSKYITKYASRNGSEDFAESYAAYVLNPKELIKIPSKYYFIQNKIFKGFRP